MTAHLHKKEFMPLMEKCMYESAKAVVDKIQKYKSILK